MIAIISDVHGNYPALKAVLKEIDRIGCNSIISLGDVTGYYCMVNECIDVFRERGIINLMGNHDSYVLEMGQCPRSTTVNNCIEYQKRIISKANREYLQASPITFDNERISARHGGWKDPIDEYIEDFNFIAVKDKRLYCSGHTHIQKKQNKNGVVYFNPGAVGQPRDGDPRAAFATIEKGEVLLHRIAYSIDEIVFKMRMEGFEDRIADCLYKGTKVKTFGS